MIPDVPREAPLGTMEAFDLNPFTSGLLHRHAPRRATGPQVGRRRLGARSAPRETHLDPCRQSFRHRRAEDEKESSYYQAQQAAAASLQTHLSRQLEKMEQIGSPYQPGGLVFATERGTFINPSNPTNRSFKPLLKRVRLPPIRFHDSDTLAPP